MFIKLKVKIKKFKVVGGITFFLFILYTLYFILTPSVHAQATPSFLRIQSSFFQNIYTIRGLTTPLTVVFIKPDSVSETLYPVIFSWDISSNTFTPDTSGWFSGLQNSYTFSSAGDQPITFDVTVPVGKDPAEYTKVFALSTQPYTTDPSSDPPVLIGVPIILQVAGIPGPGSSSSSSSSPYPTATPTPKPKKTYPFILKTSPGPSTTPAISPPSSKSSLFSLLTLERSNSAFNIFRPSEQFSLSIKNSGNQTAQPTGFIFIKNWTGQIVDKLTINPQKSYLLPGQTLPYQLEYKPHGLVAGFFNTEVWLGYTNPTMSQDPVKVFSGNFLFISPIIILFVLLVLISAFTLRLIFKKLRKHAVFAKTGAAVTLTLFIAFFGLNLYPFLKNSPHTLGTDITLTGIVRQILQLETSGTDPNNITVTSNTSPGWQLWTISGPGTGILVAEQTNGSTYTTSVQLSGSQTQIPLLLSSRGYLIVYADQP